MNVAIKALWFIAFIISGFFYLSEKEPSLKNFHNSGIIGDIEIAVDRYLLFHKPETVKELLGHGSFADLEKAGYLSDQLISSITEQTACEDINGIRFSKIRDELTLTISAEICNGTEVSQEAKVERQYDYSEDNSKLVIRSVK